MLSIFDNNDRSMVALKDRQNLVSKIILINRIGNKNTSLQVIGIFSLIFASYGIFNNSDFGRGYWFD